MTRWKSMEPFWPGIRKTKETEQIKRLQTSLSYGLNDKIQKYYVHPTDVLV